MDEHSNPFTSPNEAVASRRGDPARVTFELSERGHVSAQLALALHLRGGTTLGTALVVALVSIAAIVRAAKDGFGDGVLVACVVVVCFGLYRVLVYPLLMRASVRGIVRRLGVPTGPCDVRVEDGGLHLIGQDVTALYRWPAVRGVDVHRGVVLLWVPGSAVCLPAEAFHGEDHRDAFVALVRDRVSSGARHQTDSVRSDRR